MSSAKTSLSTRLLRSLRIMRFLFTALWRLHKMDSDNPIQRGRVINAIGALGLQILNVKLEFNHNETAAGDPTKPDNGRGMLIVANHVSWLDIFVLATLYPCSFIGMQEIKRWPVIGTVARNAGTVFINRKNRKDIDPINAAIAASLKKSQNVAFFPEARTSDGNGVLPFKAALFQSAINANAPIQPVALRYYDANGQRTTCVTFDDVNLLQSFWRIISMTEIRVRVDRCQRIFPQDHPEADRFLLKDLAEQAICEKVYADSPLPYPADTEINTVSDRPVI